MHFLRLAAICLGAWIAGSLLVMSAANQNLRIVELIMLEPENSKDAANLMMKFDKDDARLLLRHQAGEMNRWLADRWELVQIGLGIVVLVNLFLGSSGKRYPPVVCVLMLGCVAFLHWFMTPEMRNLATAVDFPRGSQSATAMDRMVSFENGYMITEWVKLGLGLVLAFGLLKTRRRQRRKTEESA